MDMTVSLTDELSEFVEAKVSSGHYASADEVIREALQIMEQVEKARLTVLREAWNEGEVGEDRPADFAGIKARGRAMLKAAGK